jgi:hypothetical protein
LAWQAGVLSQDTDHGDVTVPQAAYVSTTGECNCCGCESCQSNLVVELEASGPSHYGASRRPPSSWFLSISTDVCTNAEKTAKDSLLWTLVENSEGHTHIEPGYCIPGEDGSAWWLQPFDYQTSDGGQTISYRIWPDRGVTVSAYGVPIALRDLNGDGDIETLWTSWMGYVCGDWDASVRACKVDEVAYKKPLY